jgi:hypothetical protein
MHHKRLFPTLLKKMKINDRYFTLAVALENTSQNDRLPHNVYYVDIYIIDVIWLFTDSPAGANASAAHYSLIQTAKLHGLEPYTYLNSIFKAIPYAETVEDIEALLPWNYMRSITTV